MRDVKKRKNKYKDVLFGYCNEPTYGLKGEFVGHSFIIYNNGIGLYTTYITGIGKDKEEIFEISQEAVKKIESILNQYKNDIDTLETNLYNGSCDGSFNVFIFNGKKIETLNINYVDEEKVKRDNPKYYEGYKDVILQENKIMDIFTEICEILEEEKIKLNLHEVEFL
jgi:hypothetical protein